MEEMYFTIAGCNHYFGSDFMEKGMKVKLIKKPDNEHDKEAIQVKIKGFGKVGYVANSPYTVKGESMSAGRFYDRIGDKAKGKVVFATDAGVICRITDTCKATLDKEGDDFDLNGQTTLTVAALGNVELPIVIEGEVDAKELDIDINITNVPLLNTLKVEFEGTK